MAEGYIQLSSDFAAGGKQLDADVVTIPAGTVVSDNFGNLTTLTAPAYYYRERVTNADPTDPRGIGNVRSDVTGQATDYGLIARSPIGGIADLQTMVALLQDIDQNIATLAGTTPLVGPQPLPASSVRVASLQPPVISPDVPRPLVSDRHGRQIIIPFGGRNMTIATNVTITGTGETNIISADQHNWQDLVAIIISNTSASAVRVDIRDQPSTVVNPPSSVGVMGFYLPAGDMRGISFSVPNYQSNTNQPWTATVSSAVTDIRVWAYFNQAPSY